MSLRLETEDLAALERRMGAVAAVHQVVNAVWALARAQLPLVEAAAADAVAWLTEVEQVVARLAGPPRPPPPNARTLSVLLGPERAWCGSLPRELLAQLPSEGELGLVGRRLHELAATDERLSGRVRFKLPGAVSPEDAPGVARAVAEALLAELDVAHVEVFHPVKGGRSLARTVLLGGQRERRHRGPATLSPWDEVMRAAVFEAVTGRLGVAVVEALYSEVYARLAAAEQAKRAAARRLDELKAGWRTARQEQITNELLELVAGRAAMLGAH